ncbi:MAG: EAL domain-containing protein [Cyanobacteria bacterium P01_F01_bin.56]
MTASALNILIIEDSEDDALLVVRELFRDGFDITYERIETSEALQVLLETRVWDLVLSDYCLPKLDAPTALEVVKRSGLDIPFIVIAGSIGERLAVEMMKAGAHDYFMKDNLARLPEAVRRELREAQVRKTRKQAEASLRESQHRYATLASTVPVGIFQHDTSGNCIYVNARACEISGLSLQAALENQWRNALHPDDRDRITAEWEASFQENSSLQCEYRFQHPDGTVKWVYMQSVAEQDIDGQVIGYVGTITDISDRKQAELALQNLISGTAVIAAKDFFPALVEHIAKALDVSYTIVTEKVDETTLRTIAFWANGTLMPEHRYDLTQTPCQQVLENGDFYCAHNLQEIFPHLQDQIGLPAESYLGVLLSDAQGQAIGNLSILHQQPISEPKRAQQILQVFASRASAELQRQQAEVAIKRQLAAIEATIDGIGILKDNVYLYVNQSYLDLFGYDHADELINKSWSLLYPPREIQRFEQVIFPELARNNAWQGETLAVRKDGSTFAQGASLTLTEDGLLISICRDISEIKKAQELIIHNALHDPLTDLPNRTLLIERLELAINRSKQSPEYVYAVLFLDLDRFKVINDSLGHIIGDKVLIEITQRFKAHLRQTDLVARIGGDEFLILLENINSAEDVVEVVDRILAESYLPLVVDEHRIFIEVSIGIVVGSEKYHQAIDLIRDADIAMYRSKIEEHNSYKFFDSQMYTHVLKRLNQETDLRKALNKTNKELVVYYQPVIDLRSLQLIGFEALVRWQHPVRGLVQPDEFIPIAEETGLISLIDNWVFNQACQQLVEWKKRFPDYESLKMSVNISAYDLYQSDLIEVIDELLNRTGLAGDSIILEITESILIEDIDQTVDLLNQLNSRKIQTCIDDFGTGYSSLSYLHSLPVQSLKVDRSFVSQMQVGNRNYQVVNSIIALGHQLDLIIVAEGIESQWHLQQLQQLNCQLGQGYFFSRPLTADAASSLLDAHKSISDSRQRL